MAAYARRVVALALAGAAHAFSRSTVGVAAPTSESSTEVLRHLVGTWKAAEDRTPRETALDEHVFGRAAFGVRNVTLTIRPSGEGTLRVHTAIVGHTGRIFVPELIDVQLQLIGPVSTPRPDQFEPTVSVVGAIKRDLDPPYDRWPMVGARVVLNLPGTTSRELNIHFDTRDGRDAFGATLTRRR
jgi:hypothetical protein